MRISVPTVILAAIAVVAGLVLSTLPPAHAASGTFAQVQLKSSGYLNVGPNIQVDDNPWVPFLEPAVATNPKNSSEILGTAFYIGAGAMQPMIYRSSDGGNTWGIESAAADAFGDVQVAYDSNGTAYYAVLGSAPNPSGPGELHGGYVFRSTGRAAGWQQTAFIRSTNWAGQSGSIDHEQLAVDTSPTSRFHNRVYLSYLYAARLKPTQQNRVAVIHSDDGGRTFSKQVVITDAWVFNSPLAMLSDGTLLVPYIGPESMATIYTQGEPIGFVISRDGGATFSAPHIIAQQFRETKDFRARQARGETDFDGDGVPRYAVDHSNRFRDRIYLAWSDLRYHSSRVLFSYSADRGKTWSKTRIISADPHVRGSQYQPEVTVNREGILGIAYYDTRDTDIAHYNEYFTASLDGGKTFLPPVRVSSEPSYPAGAGNTGFLPSFSSQFEGNVDLGMLKPVNRYPSGGDYMGLTSDASGVFHPFWIDARSGIFQVETAPVSVSTARAVRPPLVAADVTTDVLFAFDQSSWDPQHHAYRVPIRLRNVSTRNLYGPFTIVLASNHNPFDKSGGPYPSIVNAQGGTGIGARLTYSDPGGAEGLRPGALSDAHIWLISPNHASDISLGAHVSGYVKRP